MGKSFRIAARGLCGIALALGCCMPAAAISPDDPAATYYERCVAPSREATLPGKGCDGPIIGALTGIIIGQFNQERPAFCAPQDFAGRTQAVERDRRHHRGLPSGKALGADSKLARQMLVKMRAAVARYMREHPERLSETTLQVTMLALLNAFPCPG